MSRDYHTAKKWFSLIVNFIIYMFYFFLSFLVDASAGGKGELEATVNHHKRIISTKKQHLGNNLYRFMFTPEETGQYEIDIRFNNEIIPGLFHFLHYYLLMD